MNVLASAPGKLVLLGEIAVLEGAPALSMAMDRRARAQLVADARCEVHAADILAAPAPLAFAADGTPRWQDAATASALALVDQLLRATAQAGMAPALAEPGFSLHLDTSAFFDRSGAGRHKLGIGSSAALTVALASALAAHAGAAAAVADRAGWLARLLQMHRDFQHGQGSGVDVATSLYGGLIEYRIAQAGRPASARPARWPQALHCCFVWSGRSASTPDLLRALQAWRAAHPAGHAACFADMTAIAEAAAAAAHGNAAAALLQAAADYAQALVRLDAASGLGIVSAEHQHLMKLAQASAVVYKTCGAGGGDVGVAFALDPAALQHFTAAFAREGFVQVPMKMDEAGLELNIMEMEEA